jgi:hypothetical protein
MAGTRMHGQIFPPTLVYAPVRSHWTVAEVPTSTAGQEGNGLCTVARDPSSPEVRGWSGARWPIVAARRLVVNVALDYPAIDFGLRPDLRRLDGTSVVPGILPSGALPASRRPSGNPVERSSAGLAHNP